MQILDLPDSARIVTARKSGTPATADDTYVLVPASLWDDVLHDHASWQYVTTPSA